MKREWTLKAAKILVLVVGCVALVGVVVMSLWNALVPDIFGGTPISWVQALGLLLLVRILAGGRGQTDGEAAGVGVSAGTSGSPT